MVSQIYVIFFKKIDDPIYVAYYYENEEKQDKIISIKAVNEFLNLVATPKGNIEIDELSTPKAHVMTSSLQSKDVLTVQKELDDFATRVMNLSSIQ